jgi:hypothetical protein
VEVVQSSVLDQLLQRIHRPLKHRQTELPPRPRLHGSQLDHPESALRTPTPSGIISSPAHIIDDTLVSKTVSPPVSRLVQTGQY